MQLPCRPVSIPPPLPCISATSQFFTCTLGWASPRSWRTASITFVYYKGGAPLYVDLVAGRVDATMSSPLSMVPYIKAGKLRAIGMTSTERVALFPDIPTVSESGAPGFEYSYWVGFTTTGGSPAAVINRLNGEFVKVARMPEVVKKLTEDAVQAIGSTPEQFRQHIDSEMNLWGRLTRELGIKLEE